ncbi:unnamed protein product [Caenorhabditis bovis]|uniref:lysozyme n=1 Tax=Caenorhabditis bovis TaxID=2654633 RepID=A0A8S1F7T3_9PELO|nr:unnamed protein product [Caenorhabditis bovis]
MLPQLLISSLLIWECAQSLLMFDKVEDDNACLLAMCDQDSGCVPIGCSIDQFDRIGCGYFRLNIYQYQQCYQPGKKDEESEEDAWMNCAQDYHCSAQCIKTLATRFRVKCYGKSDCETIARIHDGGANGCRDRNTIGYWKRVRDQCGIDCTKPILSRHL